MYNKKSFKRLSIHKSIPLNFLVEYDLPDEYTIRMLTNAIFDFQTDMGFPVIDGKLGPQTLKTILSKYAPVSARYWTYNIIRTPCSKGLNLTCYDAQNGLDLHSTGYFTPRWFINRTPTQIVIHWGGLNPNHLYACFSGARKVSSHLGVGLEDGKGVAYQYLNLTHKAWHAGRSNSVSLGVDICQQPTTKWLNHYVDRGYDVKLIDNPSSRGDKQCLSLDPRIKEQLVLSLVDLCKMFSIPVDRPNGDDVMSNPNAFKGILGHHHISKNKWDCAPWFDEIFKSVENLYPRA